MGHRRLRGVGEDATTKKKPNYVRLEGSERHRPLHAQVLGPADPGETFEATITLRRRPEGPPMPSFDDYAKVPPSRRPRLSEAEFAAKYGASPEDIAAVTRWARKAGLTIVEANAARRSIIVSGTVGQMGEAFQVILQQYEVRTPRGPHKEPDIERYRGREGAIYVPKALANVIVGVFGLDTRTVTTRLPRTVTTRLPVAVAAPSPGPGAPEGANSLTVPEVMKLYNFPTHSAAGQTLAIFALEGRGSDVCDVKAYYARLPGYTMPPTVPVSIDGAQGDEFAEETTMDVCIAGTAAQGATIAVYFTVNHERGWIDTLRRVTFPNAEDLHGAPPASVLSISWSAAFGDDGAQLAAETRTLAFIQEVNESLRDMAVQGVTCCIASGDRGASSVSSISDAKQHVAFPASSPWALACGGTTLSEVDAENGTFDEHVWSDDSGTTGGGVSLRFPLPSYQSGVGVPRHLGAGTAGRGVPDVAANASLSSGYSIPFHLNYSTVGGTSISAPLIAGLITSLNAALCQSIGFLNPTLYAIGDRVCRDINPMGHPPPAGPTDNHYCEVQGYSAGPGWDACTGWGVIDGNKLLSALRELYRCDGRAPRSLNGKRVVNEAPDVE